MAANPGKVAGSAHWVLFLVEIGGSYPSDGGAELYSGDPSVGAGENSPGTGQSVLSSSMPGDALEKHLAKNR